MFIRPVLLPRGVKRLTKKKNGQGMEGGRRGVRNKWNQGNKEQKISRRVEESVTRVEWWWWRQRGVMGGENRDVWVVERLQMLRRWVREDLVRLRVVYKGKQQTAEILLGCDCVGDEQNKKSLQSSQVHWLKNEPNVPLSSADETRHTLHTPSWPFPLTT